MGNLKNASGEISAQQAADAVAASYKAKEGTIKSANEKYEETKRILDEERYVNGTITQQQYDDALKSPRTKRRCSQRSRKQHEDVVTQAKSKRKVILNKWTGKLDKHYLNGKSLKRIPKRNLKRFGTEQLKALKVLEKVSVKLLVIL